MAAPAGLRTGADVDVVDHDPAELVDHHVHPPHLAVEDQRRVDEIAAYDVLVGAPRRDLVALVELAAGICAMLPDDLRDARNGEIELLLPSTIASFTKQIASRIAENDRQSTERRNQSDIWTRQHA